MDLPDILNSWIVAAPKPEDVDAFISSHFIIDLRGADDFASGHIESAVNSTLGNILSAASGASKPILVVCYTGQTAAHGVVALRLSGYPDAQVLKWGMAGWNSAFSGPWESNVGNIGVGNPNWADPPGDITPSKQFNYPDLSTSATDGAGILKERVSAMLSGGFSGIGNGDVLANPQNFFINNYWGAADVEHYGNIKGAYRINPLSLANVNAVDPNATVVTYCWTGQTSSMVTAYLTVLGYKAKSLKFGTNGMIYDELQKHKYTVPQDNLPVVGP
jgi:rhodanese-related sulfurtransferase